MSSMLNQCLRRLLPILRTACIAVPALLTACGGDSLHDESTGFVDLIGFYRSGATAADPTAGIPRNLAPVRGWANGDRIEYLDFGSVTVPRKLGTRGEQLRIPDNAPVFPIYFVFDSRGRPLFSKPAFDARNKLWYMRGGKGVKLPSPIEAPAAEPQRSAFFSNIYPLKPRDEFVDSDRNSSDYQRPIIDALPDTTGYTGLWEIIEITVKDSDYEIDDIKSYATIKSGLEDGKLSENATGKVINCPVIDDRTQVTPSAMHNNIPRPRMEVWFRTKLGSCYLINGWETIGEAVDESKPATDPANLRLFRAGVDQAKRVDTFDVARVSVGSGKQQQTTVTVPIGKLYTPTVGLSVSGVTVTRTRYQNDDLATAVPRHKQSDPGGYSPIVWLWDLNVPQDPPYQPGSYKNINAVDPASTVARDGESTVVTRSVAIIGKATRCVSDSDCSFGLTCNTMPDIGIATMDPPPGSNIADMVIAREGGPRCDVPAATFGGLCGPGVARCDVQAAAGSDNENALKALGVGSAGPTFTVHADLKAAKQKLSDNQSLASGVDPANPTRVVTDAEKATAAAAIAANQRDVDTLTARVAYYDGWGFTKDLGGYGYLCHPPNAALGYCQIRCDSTASASATQVKAKVPVRDALVPGKINEIEWTFNTDARCGGANMLGYKCGHSANNGTVSTTILPERQRVCLRDCATFVPLNQSSAVCDFPLNLKADASSGKPNTAFKLGGGLPAMSAVTGQMCSAVSLANAGVTATVPACNWNPDFEPRDPNVWPGAR
ncbi:MAG: hypothetical protein ACOY0T_36725 [Myxococcota bacterium]